jgi:hypothetical protein
MIVVEKIKPLGELLFLKQFIIFSLLFLVILPTLMVIIGNIYFKLVNKKDWFSWLKIPECYDDIFTIIAIFPSMYLIMEVGIFFAYYTKLFELNEIILIIIFGIIGGLLFVLTQIVIRKIYRLIYKKRDLLYKYICGRIIIKIIYIHDYIQIYFNDNGILNLYNKTIINGEDNMFINKIVKDIFTIKNKLIIYCNKNLFIEMSMLDKDYVGPEAIEYNNEDITIVV